MSAALVATVRMHARRADAGDAVRQAIAEGFRYSVGTPLVRGVMIVIGVVMVAAAVRTPLEPLFILRTLGEQPAALGLAAGAWGVGMVLGSGIAPTLSRHLSRQRMLSGALAVVGVAVVASAAARCS